MQRGGVGGVGQAARVYQPHLRQGGADVGPGLLRENPSPPEMSVATPPPPSSSSTPTGLCCICPSVESSGRLGHPSPSRSAGGLLPAGQWGLGAGRRLELLLPPHLGQDLLNLPLGQLRDKSQGSDSRAFRRKRDESEARV